MPPEARSPLEALGAGSAGLSPSGAPASVRTAEPIPRAGSPSAVSDSTERGRRLVAELQPISIFLAAVSLIFGSCTVSTPSSTLALIPSRSIALETVKRRM